MKDKITIIGAGNVATHLAKALSKHFEIACIAARTIESATSLAKCFGAEAVTDLSAIPSECSLYLIAVNDDSIKDVVDATTDYPGIWAHTSGSVGVDVFVGKKSNYGVFYPLQTFSKNSCVDVSEVPILIEGNRQTELVRIAEKISEHVIIADSRSREAIHVAAVFACNFANLMWIEADELLRDASVGDISLFTPLLKQTLAKLNEMSPRDAMTGPARRGDTQVIEKHLNRLEADPKAIYSLLSDRILKIYSKA